MNTNLLALKHTDKLLRAFAECSELSGTIDSYLQICRTDAREAFVLGVSDTTTDTWTPVESFRTKEEAIVAMLVAINEHPEFKFTDI